MRQENQYKQYEAKWNKVAILWQCVLGPWNIVGEIEYVLIFTYHLSMNNEKENNDEIFRTDTPFYPPLGLFDMIPPLLTWLILLCSIDHTSTIVRDNIKRRVKPKKIGSAYPKYYLPSMPWNMIKALHKRMKVNIDKEKNERWHFIDIK